MTEPPSPLRMLLSRHTKRREFMILLGGAAAAGPPAARAQQPAIGCGSQWEDVQTAPVGSFAANPFGLHDMHGNVWEWVEDCYQSNYDGAPTDGSARLSPDCTNHVNHVVRGGSWVAWQVPWTGRSARGGSWVWVQVPQPARSASRENYAKNNLRSFIGFRVGRAFTP